MSSSHESYMSIGLSGGVNSRFEPINAGKMTSAVTYGYDRFHPYTCRAMSRQRNSYDASFTGCIYPGNYRSVPLSSVGGTYSTDGGNNFKQETCQLSYRQLYNESHMKTNQHWAFTQRSIHNLCELNAETGTSLQTLSSAPGKDRSHPFYSRKRVEPAEGMTRTRDKYRVVYTEKQRRGLEKEYNANKFITTEIRAKISKILGLSARQIKIWFQNRRAKERRDSRKEKNMIETENGSVDEDNDTDEYSSSTLDNTNGFSQSCRFTGSERISEERRFVAGQFPNGSGTVGISSNTAAQLRSCQFASHAFKDARPSLSPSEWRMPTGNSDFQDVRPSISPSEWRMPIESGDFQYVRPSISPSEWRMSSGSSLLPTVDLSPLTGNGNCEFELRL